MEPPPAIVALVGGAHGPGVVDLEFLKGNAVVPAGFTLDQRRLSAA